ncbi:uncharacterized protein LOC143333564 isoform X2 [Chaetodon auriga]|uniref:uncharacterized protein LOC143333564 isoform X2 n=1 Tax=Chaetodon auriga TaxID=39042 RepID=UPI004032A0D6
MVCFDEMTRKSLIFLVFCIGKSLECLQRNTSCNDIKTINGFKFLHEGPEGSEVFVSDDQQTVIAHAKLANQSFDFTSEVRSMDKHSVITTACRDLKVSCIVHSENGYITEFCLDFKIIGEKMLPGGQPTPWNLIIGASSGVLIAALGVIGVLCYKTQLGTATVSQFRSLLSCARSGNFQAEREQERAGQGEELSVPDPPEDVSEQDSTLESVLVVSLDHNLNDEEIQPPENGNTMTPEISRATNHRAMHRNLGDDPGGVNDNKGKDIPREMPNGRTHGDCDEDDEAEERALLLCQRADIRGSDMTGEVAALVNKRDFEPDQVSGCSTAPDTDVESTFNMKCTQE